MTLPVRSPSTKSKMPDAVTVAVSGPLTSATASRSGAPRVPACVSTVAPSTTRSLVPVIVIVTGCVTVALPGPLPSLTTTLNTSVAVCPARRKSISAPVGLKDQLTVPLLPDGVATAVNFDSSSASAAVCAAVAPASEDENDIVDTVGVSTPPLSRSISVNANEPDAG